MMDILSRPITRALMSGVAGLLIGLLVGWVIWPVKYVGEAYTYELNTTEKLEYVATAADSYALTRDGEAARQRFNAWTVEEKAGALAQLFVEDQAQGKVTEAARVAGLAAALRNAEAWNTTTVEQVTGQIAAEYRRQKALDRMQYVAIFAAGLGAAPAVEPSPTGATGSVLDVGAIAIPLACGGLALMGGLGGAMFLWRLYLRNHRGGGQGTAPGPTTERARVEWAMSDEAPLPLQDDSGPLKQWTSTYRLGMDNFDESFTIATEDGTLLGECGMGIVEMGMGDQANLPRPGAGESPRRVKAFWVWLFDKGNLRTISRVLVSETDQGDAQRYAQESGGKPVPATPGATFTLESGPLSVEARVLEVEYASGGHFETLSVTMAARVVETT